MSDNDADGDSTYWALIGGSIFLIVVAFFSAWIISGYQAGEGVRSQQYSEDARSNPDHELRENCRRFTVPDEIFDCLSEQIGESREGSRSEQDLYAQRNMATAAWAMIGVTSVLGLLTFGVSIYAAVLLKDTLRVNADAVKVARESMVLQERPFFVFEDAQVSYRVNGNFLEYEFNILIVNGSNKVAFIKRSLRGYGLNIKDGPGSQLRSNKALPNTIGPGGKASVQIAGKVKVSEVNKTYSADRRLGLIFVIRFEYTGIAGGLFEDEFWFDTYLFGVQNRADNAPIIQIAKPRKDEELGFVITEYVD